MSEVTLNAEQLKTLLKVALVEILQEQKEDWLTPEEDEAWQPL